MTDSKNFILHATFHFAIGIVSYCELLQDMKKYNLASQLINAGTSIGANVNEAQHAESISDFIHKNKIAAKEAAETHYWLRICQAIDSYPDPNHLLLELEPIQKVLTSIIYTSKNKSGKK